MTQAKRQPLPGTYYRGSDGCKKIAKKKKSKKAKKNQ